MTVLEVVSRALRMLGVLAGGRVPKAQDSADALAVLQDLYFDIIDQGCDLTDVRILANYTAGEDERIFDTVGSLVVTLPTYITDTSVTPDSAGNQRRPPHDFAVVSVAGATRETHVYDAHLGAWVEIEALTLPDDAPWGTQLGQGLAAMLAVEIAPEFGVEPSQSILARAAATRLRVIARMQSGSVFFAPDLRWS